MADTLFFRFHGDDIEWLVFNGFGKKHADGRGSAEQFREAVASGYEGMAVLVVPGSDVLLTTAAVPSRQYRQIIQAVPYAIEENLATDVEDCFFALGPRNADDRLQVIVVDRLMIRGWIDQVAALGLKVQTMLPEPGLVASGTSIRGVVDSDLVHLRWPDGSGMTVPCADLPLTLGLDQTNPSLVLTGSETSLESVAMQVSELQAAGVNVELEPIEESGFYLLCCQFTGGENNLLQGALRVEESRSPAQLVWRSVAVLALIALTLHLATLAGQGWYLSQRASEYEAGALTLYKEVFPGDKNVRDLRRRWDSHLGNTGGQPNEFISLFSMASRGLPEAGLTLHNVNFNESRGDLILQVIAERSEELVQYSQALSGAGLTADIGTISQEDNAVRGSIKVRAGGAGS